METFSNSFDPESKKCNPTLLSVSAPSTPKKAKASEQQQQQYAKVINTLSSIRKSSQSIPPVLNFDYTSQMRRKDEFIVNKGLQDTLSENGITHEEFVKAADNTLSYNIFSSHITTLDFIEHFSELTSLCIMRQDLIITLSSILHNLPRLESLCIIDCSLTKFDADSFSCSNKLKVLNLSGNKLTSDVLSLAFRANELQELCQLWINDNKLVEMKAFKSLTNLRVLWVCRNKIERIGDSLSLNSRLTELNISDNRVGCFKELLHLSSLTKLTSIALNDPHFGSNPITSLCNYQTYALYHLPQISVLDNELVTDDAKSLAQSIYMKKKMYYNMRKKTLKRNATNVSQRAQEIYLNKLSNLSIAMNVLLRNKKDTEGVLEMSEWAGLMCDADLFGVPNISTIESLNNFSLSCRMLKSNPISEGIRSALIKKEEALRVVIRTLDMQMRKMDALLENAKDVIIATSNTTIKRLMLEFHTGGNIRVEEGKPSDLWFNSCIDLVHSRFSQDHSAFNKMGIKGIRVNRISRIHNRFLRHRFEAHVREILEVAAIRDRPSSGRGEGEGADTRVEKMSVVSPAVRSAADAPHNGNTSFGGTSSKVPKRMLEYLFYGMSPRLSQLTGQNDEIVRVAEDGFRTSQEYKSFGFDESIRLHNTVDGADLERIEHSVDCFEGSSNDWTNSRGAPSSILSGQMLLVKTFVGKRVEIDYAHYNEVTHKVSAAQFANFQSAYYCPLPSGSASGGLEGISADSLPPKQKVWHLFNPALALPEYLIDYEYLTAESRTYNDDRTFMLSDLNRSLIGASGVIDDPHENACADMVPFLYPLAAFIESIETIVSKNSQSIEASYASAVAMAPKILAKVKICMLTPDSILNFANTATSDFSKILYLNLHGHRIKKIENLAPCVRCKVLILSFNELSDIEGLTSLQDLERIELGFNLIKRIGDLRGLDKLVHIELNNNLLNRLEDVQSLAKQVPLLIYLDLRANPMCKARSYRGSALLSMLAVQMFDGQHVSDQDRCVFLNKDIVLTIDLIRNLGYGTSSTGVDGDRPGATSSLDPKDTCWMKRVEEIDCSHQHLLYLANLEGLINLRKACFSDNELTCIEGLSQNAKIEELNFESNRLVAIENLGTMIKLRKLELGHNKIFKIPNLEMLTRLTQISLENNEIQSVKPLQTVVSLMEVYIGNNEIEDIMEMEYLKSLPRLIILDVSGNPFCSRHYYRLSIIYKIRKLKVLDGVGVSLSEIFDAMEMYSGKLTKEFIVERVGHSFFEHIREVNLDRCKVKDVAVMRGVDFRNLREINLNNNSIADLSTFQDLPGLAILRLNNNHIESFRPSSSTTPTNSSPSTPTSRTNAGNSESDEQHFNQKLCSSPALYPVPPSMNLINLEVLHLGFNKITDIRELELHNFPNLMALYLPGNDISKVDGLKQCVELRDLVLDKNRIRSLDQSSLSGLRMLKYLRIDENRLKSLNNFPSLSNLDVLSIANNQIKDIAELEKLFRVWDLQEISFTNNPVTRRQLYRLAIINIFASIRIIDGREVSVEEKEQALQLVKNDRSGRVSDISSCMPNNLALGGQLTNIELVSNGSGANNKMQRSVAGGNKL